MTIIDCFNQPHKFSQQSEQAISYSALMKTPCLFLLVILSLTSCALKESPFRIKGLTESFYNTCAIHEDFKGFMDYYANDILLKDIVNGDQIVGKASLAQFFDWSNPHLTRKDSLALVVQEIICNENQAVVSGYFTPFQWQPTTFEAMLFTTILTFNQKGKIIK